MRSLEKLVLKFFQQILMFSTEVLKMEKNVSEVISGLIVIVWKNTE